MFENKDVAFAKDQKLKKIKKLKKEIF